MGSHSYPTVVLLENLPDKNLERGMVGVVVERHPGGAVEVEFVNDMGKSEALVVLALGQYLVLHLGERTS